MNFYCSRERHKNDQAKKHGSLCLEELNERKECRYHGKEVAPKDCRETSPYSIAVRR